MLPNPATQADPAGRLAATVRPQNQLGADQACPQSIRWNQSLVVRQALEHDAYQRGPQSRNLSQHFYRPSAYILCFCIGHHRVTFSSSLTKPLKRTDYGRLLAPLGVSATVSFFAQRGFPSQPIKHVPPLSQQPRRRSRSAARNSSKMASHVPMQQESPRHPRSP
jgi:hypothetical protein